MKHLRRFNWILAAITWFLAGLFGLSNWMGWESAWMISGMLYALLMRLSLLISLSTLIADLTVAEPEEKKGCVLRSLLVLAISALVAIPALFVFGTWFGFGELSGAC